MPAVPKEDTISGQLATWSDRPWERPEAPAPLPDIKADFERLGAAQKALEAQAAVPDPDIPDESSQWIDRMFQSTDGWEKFLPSEAMQRVRTADGAFGDARVGRMKMAVTALLADAFNEDPARVSEMLPVYMESFSQQVWKAPSPQDVELFYHSTSVWKRQNALEQKMLNELNGELAETVMAGLASDEAFYAAFREQKKKRGALPGYNAENEDIYFQVADRMRATIEAQQSLVAPAIRAANEYLMVSRALPPRPHREDMLALDGYRRRAEEQLLGLSAKDQQFVLSVATARASRQMPQNKGEGFLPKLSETLDRGAEQFLVYGAYGLGRTSRALLRAPDREEVSHRRDTARRLRNASLAADPLKTDSWFSQSFLDASQSFPRLAAALHPVGLAVNYLSYAEEARGEFLDQGISPGLATGLGYTAGVPYAALDRLSAAIIFKGKTPGVGVLKSGMQNLAGRIAIHGGVQMTEQYLAEVLQDLTVPTVQQMARVFTDAVPEVNWSETFNGIGDAAPETIGALAWYVLLGTGTATMRDRAQAQALYKQQTQLKALGFRPAVVKSIMDAKTPEDANLILQTEWSNRYQNEAIVSKLEEESALEQRQAIVDLNAQAASIGPGITFVESQDGSIDVVDPIGRTVGTAKTPELAGQIAAQHTVRLQNERMLRQADFERAKQEMAREEAAVIAEELESALREGQLAGAESIVFSPETPPQDIRLVELDAKGLEATRERTRLEKGSPEAIQQRESLLARLEQWADGKLIESEGRLYANPFADPDWVLPRVAKGAVLIARGATDFAKWSAQMTAEFGEGIAEHLERLWQSAKLYAGRLEKQATTLAKKLDPQTQFTIQRPMLMGDVVIPGYIQVDLFEGDAETGGRRNTRSTNISQLREEGYQIPDVPDFLPDGRYTLQQITSAKPTARPTQSSILSGTRVEAWADKVLAEASSRLYANPMLEPKLLAAWGVKGAAVLERGIRDFAKWSVEMLKLYGPTIERHLEAIYRQSLSMANPEKQAQGGDGAAYTLETAVPGVVRNIPKSVLNSGKPASVETIRKLAAAVREAEPMREEQEKGYSEERSRRAALMYRAMKDSGGVTALAAMQRAASGEMPKKKFESLSDQFSPAELNELLDHIYEHASLAGLTYTKYNAALALKNMVLHGVIPRTYEIGLFEQVFGSEVVDAVLKHVPLSHQTLEAILEIIGIPKNLVASLDLSASLRQGFSLAVSHPGVASDAFVAQLRALVNPEYATALDNMFRTGKKADIREDAGLDLADLGPSKKGLTKGEERFVMGRLWRKIRDLRGKNTAAKVVFAPVVGQMKLVEASNRAYVTYLNKLRVEVFDAVDLELQAAKLPEHRLAHERKLLAKLINAATGRGNLSFGDFGTILNAAYFSPRFVVSRFEYPMRAAYMSARGLTGGGRFVLGKEATRQLVAQAAVWGTLFALVSYAAKAFEWPIEFDFDDPRDPNYLKLRIAGKTTIDFGAGYGQTARLMARLFTNKSYDQRGNLREGVQLGSEVGRFMEYKLAPVARVAEDWRSGRTFSGEEPTALGTAKTLTVSISIQNIVECVEEHGILGALLAVPDVLGLGVNIYDPKGSSAPVEEPVR